MNTDRKDYDVEYYYASDQLVNESPRAVKILHRPSGIRALSESARTAVHNVALAVREIEQALSGEMPDSQEISEDISDETNTDEISDGYHTFGELYEHRSILFIALMCSHLELSWFSPLHQDGSMYPGGWFVAGMQLPAGQITYHLRVDPWYQILRDSNVSCLERAPDYDGHSSNEVIDRVKSWILNMNDKENLHEY